jgi:uncharacterized protein YegL
MTTEYENVATSDNPALIVYLLDISGSMGEEMPGGKTRLEIVQESLYEAIKEMVGRSSKAGVIRPRYRVAVYAYSDDVYDIFDGIKTVDEIADKGIPALTAQNRTNMAGAFSEAKKLITKDIAGWRENYLNDCPAPLVVHMTDALITERFDNPVPIAQEIQEIKVPDGKVLVENIFITNEIKIPTQDFRLFPGYKTNEVLSNPFAQKLLTMSSVMPEAYRTLINKNEDMSLEQGAVLMFPGISPEFVRAGFVISKASGIAKGKKKIVDD